MIAFDEPETDGRPVSATTPLTLRTGSPPIEAKMPASSMALISTGPRARFQRVTPAK